MYGVIGMVMIIGGLSVINTVLENNLDQDFSSGTAMIYGIVSTAGGAGLVLCTLLGLLK